MPSRIRMEDGGLINRKEIRPQSSLIGSYLTLHGKARTLCCLNSEGMRLEEARVLDHREISGGYRLLVLAAPAISPEVRPGQFVHVRVPHYETALLRRPFSVYKTEASSLSILYKNVGRGTATLTHLQPGDSISILGPLGHGFPEPDKKHIPVLVAGGYGMAALYLVARLSARKGVAFFGGRSTEDILCADEFTSLGWDLRVATEDGTSGYKGLVTEPLDAWLSDGRRDQAPEFFACGPNAMLKAVGDRAICGGWKAWLSMDRNMGCGVGACLTCVQKIRQEDGSWQWKRCCKEGPVFEAREIMWEEGSET